MYDRVLFPTDGSEAADATLDYALQIASAHDATVHVLDVADTDRDALTEVRGDVVDALERDGDRIVEETARRVRDHGVPVVSEVRRGDPSATIVEYATRTGVDLIVMATHGRRGLERFLLGSVTERVINTADVPVVSVTPDSDRAFSYPCQDVLVPTDGSRGAELALGEGIAVANATGATLHLLHVVETGSLGPDTRSLLTEDGLTERANRILTEAAETAERASVESIEREIEHGVPYREIRSYLQANRIDLAVLGTRGETDFARYTMGSVSARIVRTAPVPVTWVRDSGS